MADITAVEEVLQVLEARGFQAEEKVRFDWLTSRAPTEQDMPAPPRIKYRLLALHQHLGGDWERLAEKKKQYLRFDIQVDESTVIEVDEMPHFSTARLETLDYYDGLDHGLDLDLYRALCTQYAEAADAFQRSRKAVDFPFVGGRIAQRAYFDTAKDLLAAAHGLRLIRVPAPTEELRAGAELTLRVQL